MKRNLEYPIIFTFLAFCINSIVDEGKCISIKDMEKHIENRSVWDLLREQSTNPELIIELYPEQQQNELMDYFESSLNTIGAGGITNNGYCLLLAYMINAIQNGKESGWFASLK